MIITGDASLTGYLFIAKSHPNTNPRSARISVESDLSGSLHSLRGSTMKKTVLEELERIVGKENMSAKTADLYVYGFDASIHHKDADAVVRPANTQPGSEIVKLANRTRTPAIPRGAGTAMCGHTIPLKGGIILDLTPMNKIKEGRVEDLSGV